jgi:hypothetical protein
MGTLIRYVSRVNIHKIFYLICATFTVRIGSYELDQTPDLTRHNFRADY